MGRAAHSYAATSLRAWGANIVVLVARLLLGGETASECCTPIHEVCLQRATMLAAPHIGTFPTREMEMIHSAALTAAYRRAACQQPFIMKAESARPYRGDEPLRRKICP